MILNELDHNGSFASASIEDWNIDRMRLESDNSYRLSWRKFFVVVLTAFDRMATPKNLDRDI